MRGLRSVFLTAGLLFASLTRLGYAAETTITSDDLELRNNGALTIFTGHVVLKQDPYEVRSDRMVRSKATGVVDAKGHIQGTWISLKGEKVKVTGDLARYTPKEKTLEVWGPDRVHVQLDGEKEMPCFTAIAAGYLRSSRVEPS